jgi:hypothetical protein
VRPAVFDTSNGRVEIAFGVNRWVLVTTKYESVQRQADDEAELARVLYDAGVPRSETKGVATQAWRSRPRNAGMTSAHPDEAILRATGFSSRGRLLLVGTVFLVAIVATLVITVIR